MKNLLLLLSSSLIICQACNDHEDAPAPQTDPIEIELKSYEKEWAANGNDFAMNLLLTTGGITKKENVLLSPLSLQFALGMTSNGATTTGFNEIATALGFDDCTPEALNDYFYKLTSQLMTGDPQVKLNLANAAWVQMGFTVKDKFIQTLKEMYKAQVGNVDFVNAPDEAKNTINKWSDEQTNGLIKELDLSITPLTRLILANACYLKGTWTVPFEKTAKDNFTTASGVVQQIDMMTVQNRFNYREYENCQIVELPYGNQSFSMMVVLPAKGKSVEDVAGNIRWEDITLHGATVKVSVPKFKLKAHTELNEILKSMGIMEIFTENSLPDIAEDLAVSRIFQDMVIETDEKGTEAAAVTVVEMETTAFPGAETTILEMKVDRPFLFTIRENSTGVIMFMGKVGSIY